MKEIVLIVDGGLRENIHTKEKKKAEEKSREIC